MVPCFAAKASVEDAKLDEDFKSLGFMAGE